MARYQRDKRKESRSTSADGVASTGGPSNLGAARPAATEQAPDAGAERADEAGPVIVVYGSSERDSKTRLQIVQSGFGSMSAWTAIVDAWRDTSASFALLSARARAAIGQTTLASLRGALRVPALSPVLRPALAQP